jgi:hypothetical protein
LGTTGPLGRDVAMPLSIVSVPLSIVSVPAENRFRAPPRQMCGLATVSARNAPGTGQMCAVASLAFLPGASSRAAASPRARRAPGERGPRAVAGLHSPSGHEAAGPGASVVTAWSLELSSGAPCGAPPDICPAHQPDRHRDPRARAHLPDRRSAGARSGVHGHTRSVRRAQLGRPSRLGSPGVEAGAPSWASATGRAGAVVEATATAR